MPDAFEFVNKNAAAVSEADRDRMEQARRCAELSYRKIRRTATRTLLIRALSAVAIVFGLWLAQRADLIAWQLAAPCQTATMVWFAVWFGAWLQFMWCKEGLMQ